MPSQSAFTSSRLFGVVHPFVFCFPNSFTRLGDYFRLKTAFLLLLELRETVRPQEEIANGHFDKALKYFS